MTLSKLGAKCRSCPKVDTCDHKEMEAYGFLPLPTQQETIIFSEPSESSPQSTAKGYRHIENFWGNPKMLIPSKPDSSDQEINTDELVKEIARVFQLPERLLRGDE